MYDALTYHAALQLLPVGKSRLVSLLNSVASTGLSAWAASSTGASEGTDAPLSILEIGNDIVEFAQDTLRVVPEWRSGISRFTRSQQLAALHSVIVVSAYFEAFADSGLPGSLSDLNPGSAAHAAPTAHGTVPDGYGEIVEFMLREPLPLPQPHVPHADVRQRVVDCYDKLSGGLVKFVIGLPARDEHGAGARDALREAIQALPAGGLDRYDMHYRALAAGNREFGTWAGTTEVPALGVCLSGMSSHLVEMAIRRPGQRTRSPLAVSYQATLDDAVITSGQAPEGVVLPTLGEAYVDPVCKVAEVGPGDRPSEAAWWENRPLVPDIGTFLAGYLTSLRATRAPLVVLGEPGSGKSKLVEVIAAQLPEQDFFPVLVPLRDVAAESMVQEQVEQAIAQGPGRHASWHELLEMAGEALPVVLLDGLDELIQATAVNRYDYLEQVRDFQLRQLRIRRPIGVVITSRTVVADLVRFPGGSLAVQLQPFTDVQVRRWLDIWDRHNAPVLAERGLRPLPAATAFAHRELTEQPLLLLLVAIFDAAENDLQRLDSRLGRAELYERLLTEFARREVTKAGRNRALPAHRQQRLALREVQRLAVVALAMFVRGRQAASEAELNQALHELFAGDDDGPDSDSDLLLTPAQRATGRFFFVHKSEARLRDERVRSYEFLHATFGEFLVARLAVNALRDLAAYREVMRHGTTMAGQLDDGFLYAALSFSCLVSRTPIVGFLAELLHQLPDDVRALCRETLGELIAQSLFPRPSRSFQQFEPVRDSITRRLACYSANLVLMLVLLAENINASEFLGTIDTGKKWAKFGNLWRAMLTSSEWRSLTDAIRVRPSRANDSVDILLTPEDGSPVSPTDSIIITETPSGLISFDIHVTSRESISYDTEILSSSIAGRAFRQMAFAPDWHISMLLLQTVPFIRATGGHTRYELSDGTTALPGYMLAHLDHAVELDRDQRLEIYEAFADTMAVSPQLEEQFLGRLRRDLPDFTVASVIRVLRAMGLTQLTEFSAGIINTLWDRAESDMDKQSLAQLVTELSAASPDGITWTLNEGVRNFADRVRHPPAGR